MKDQLIIKNLVKYMLKRIFRGSKMLVRKTLPQRQTLERVVISAGAFQDVPKAYIKCVGGRLKKMREDGEEAEG